MTNLRVSKIVLSILLFSLSTKFSSVFSQDSTSSRHQVNSMVEANLYGFSGATPFWFRANQYGTIPNQLPTLNLRASRHELRSFKKNNNWKYGYGAEVVLNAVPKSNFVLPEFYASLRYKIFELYAGRRKETFGLCDSTLGMGSYIWSGNALPMPKVTLQVLEYTVVPYTKGWLQFKGSYAHGWFGENRFVSHNFLHQKTLYLRLGKPQSQFKWHAGFNHQVQWGGIANYDASAVTNDQKFPGNLLAYYYVVTGIGGAVGRVKQFSAFDSTNRVGNHLGTLDLGMEIALKRSQLFLYRQTIYEDGTPFYGGNLADGLHGIAWSNQVIIREKRKWIIKKILVEFLNTISQGGNTFYAGALRNNNYFNHQQFRDGWTYQGRVIGTPFVTNRFDSKEKFQGSDFHNGFENANNNRVQVYHVGVQGYLGKDIAFLSKISFSKNYGTYGFPYPTTPRQYSGLVQVTGKLPYLGGLQWTAATAWDYGGLYDDSFALRLGVRKTWNK